MMRRRLRTGPGPGGPARAGTLPVPAVFGPTTQVPEPLTLGTFASQTTGTLTPGLPGGLVAGDVMLALIAQQGSPVWSAAGWTLERQMAAWGSEGLSLYWRRYEAGDTAPVGPFDGNSCARIMAVRGCVATGSPIEGRLSAYNSVAGTSFTSGTVTTLGPARRVFCAMGRDVDSSAAWVSGMAAPGLTELTEHYDQGHTLGLGGGIALYSGKAAGPAAYGPFSATVLNSRVARITFALVPA